MNLLEKENARHSKNQILKGETIIEKKKTFLAKFLDFSFYSIMIGFIIVLFLMYGPYNGFRDWYITTAMTTMTHQYLATWFFSAETINEVLSNNKVVEVDGITDTSQIIISEEPQNNKNYANEYERAVLEKDSKHPEYKLIEIKEKNYAGYLAVVYDASKIHTLVTEKLDRSGQYVTTMAKNKKAVLAINGGGFEDLNHNSSGGTPLGLTFAEGKLITNHPYSGPGGLIGFDENDKLVLGKMSAEKAKSMKVRDAVTCGPFLIINGEASKVVGNGGWGTAPRTAIGQRKDGIVLMLTIDGRRATMPGATMEDLLKIMQNYGAYNASALDGGTSTAMVENGKLVNDPIDSTGSHATRPIATGFGAVFDK